MCVVSSVGDDFTKGWPSNPANPWRDVVPYPMPGPLGFIPDNKVTREEFDALKKEVLELKRVLEAAKRYDESTGQPDCHHGEKVALIRKLAEVVGISMDDIFNPKEQ